MLFVMLKHIEDTHLVSYMIFERCLSETTNVANMNYVPYSYLATSYMAKHLRGKTFVFRVENAYSLENFHGSMLVDLYYQSTRQ